MKSKQATITKDLVLADALAACVTLIEAYKRGERNGGSVDWDDVDAAHDIALLAVRSSKRLKKQLNTVNYKFDGSRPLPPGSVIEYVGMQATVVDDRGGKTLIVSVDDDGEGPWSWKFEGRECTVVSVPKKN